MPFEEVNQWSLALLELQKDLAEKKQTFDEMKKVMERLRLDIDNQTIEIKKQMEENLEDIYGLL
jgi:CII-binding regulator of phage lambda lysogenization HflD